MTSKLVSISLGLMLAWAAGCGGDVNGGSGGGGAGGGTTTTTTKTDPKSVCTQLCEVGQQAGCLGALTMDECVTGCTQQYADTPECSKELNTMYECGIDKVPVSGCDVETSCATETAAAKACTNNGCGATECAGDGTSCSCNTTCNGVGHQMDCDSSSGTTKCTCTEDSAVVGMCDATDLNCDLEAGCCAQYWSK